MHFKVDQLLTHPPQQVKQSEGMFLTEALSKSSSKQTSRLQASVKPFQIQCLTNTTHMSFRLKNSPGEIAEAQKFNPVFKL